MAYADFVTAMMAFFLVMWIVAQSEEVKAGVAGYFRDPSAMVTQGGRGVLPGAESGATGGGAPMGVTDVESAKRALEQAAEQIREALAALPEFEDLKDQVEITLTEEGLRIELREAPDDGFFDSGSARSSRPRWPCSRSLANSWARCRTRWPWKGILTAGRTRRTVRRTLTGSCRPTAPMLRGASSRARGFSPSQIEAVRGFADMRLRNPTIRSIRGTAVSRSSFAAAESLTSGL